MHKMKSILHHDSKNNNSKQIKATQTNDHCSLWWASFTAIEYSPMLWFNNKRWIPPVGLKRYNNNLNCHLLSLKNFSTPPIHSAHLLPTYSFLLLFWEAVFWRDGNLYKIFPCITSNLQVYIKWGGRGKKKFRRNQEIHYVSYITRNCYLSKKFGMLCRKHIG